LGVRAPSLGLWPLVQAVGWHRGQALGPL